MMGWLKKIFKKKKNAIDNRIFDGIDYGNKNSIKPIIFMHRLYEQLSHGLFEFYKIKGNFYNKKNLIEDIRCKKNGNIIELYIFIKKDDILKEERLQKIATLTNTEYISILENNINDLLFYINNIISDKIIEDKLHKLHIKYNIQKINKTITTSYNITYYGYAILFDH